MRRSKAMLECLPRSGLPAALGSLGGRLARHGRMVIFITRKNLITKFLIERCWKAHRYTREELRDAVITAGLRVAGFKKFSLRYFRQNFWGHIVETGRA